MKVVLIGAGGHCKVVIDALLARYGRNDVIGILDDDVRRLGDEVLGIPIVGTTGELENYHSTADYVHVCIGSNVVRKYYYELATRLNYAFLTIIHPHSFVSPFASVGAGALVNAGAVINAEATIGDNVIVNTGATIDHDSCVSQHVHICPGVHLAGGVRVGEGTQIGIGASVIQNTKIGSWSVIGAGSAVLRDVEDRTVAYGVPCKPRTLR